MVGVLVNVPGRPSEHINAWDCTGARRNGVTVLTAPEQGINKLLVTSHMTGSLKEMCSKALNRTFYIRSAG